MDSRKFLTDVRRRCVASILGHIEKEPWYKALTPPQKEALRQKVLDSISMYHDTVLDVVRALDEPDEGFQPKAMQMLAEIHARVADRPMARTG